MQKMAATDEGDVHKKRGVGNTVGETKEMRVRAWRGMWPSGGRYVLAAARW